LHGAEDAAEGITLRSVTRQFEKEYGAFAGLWGEVTNRAGKKVFKKAESVPKGLERQSFCPFDWWAAKRENWRILSLLACLVLSIPASSVDEKYIFPQAESTMSDLRTSSDTNCFHKMMVILGNFLFPRSCTRSSSVSKRMKLLWLHNAINGDKRKRTGSGNRTRIAALIFPPAQDHVN
jgi:hypothetical protein